MLTTRLFCEQRPQSAPGSLLLQGRRHISKANVGDLGLLLLRQQFPFPVRAGSQLGWSSQWWLTDYDWDCLNLKVETDSRRTALNMMIVMG